MWNPDPGEDSAESLSITRQFRLGGNEKNQTPSNSQVRPGSDSCSWEVGGDESVSAIQAAKTAAAKTAFHLAKHEFEHILSFPLKLH